jgi:hypothetical protein
MFEDLLPPYAELTAQRETTYAVFTFEARKRIARLEYWIRLIRVALPSEKQRCLTCCSL